MMNFDSWEAAARPPEDYLMHFRTRGSKNGVRRYQNPDGSWTELGLRERREREGWGDSKAERRANKAVAKAERRLARSERRAERKQKREQRQFERAEKKRKSKLSGLTDEEMKAKLERARMEHEYKELTQNKSLLESGANAVSKYLEYKDNKAKRIMDMNRMKVDMARAKAEKVKAVEGRKRAVAEADKARYENRGVAARKKAAKELLDSKREYKNYTVRGGIGRAINLKLTSGKAKEYEAIRKAKGDVEANRIKTEGQRKANEDQKRYTQKQADDAARKAKQAADKAKREANRQARKVRRWNRQYGQNPLN